MPYPAPTPEFFAKSYERHCYWYRRARKEPLKLRKFIKNAMKSECYIPGRISAVKLDRLEEKTAEELKVLEAKRNGQQELNLS